MLRERRNYTPLVPICHAQAPEASDLISSYTVPLGPPMLVTRTRGAHKPECGSGAPFGEPGPIPLIWVNTSRLLGRAASWPAGGRSVLPCPHLKESRMWEKL